MNRFRIGDKVRILTEVTLKDGPRKNVAGVVEKVDGQYVYVRPNYYKHFIELCPNEIELIKK